MKKFLYFLSFLLLVSLGIFLYWYFQEKGSVPKVLNFPANPFGFFTNNKPPVIKNGGGGGFNQGAIINGSSTVIIPDKEKLFEKIWSEPVAGYSLIDFTTYESTSTEIRGKITFKEVAVASSTLILFVDRATGHVYKKTAFVGKGPTQVANTTIPGVHDAYFFNGGSEVLLRSLRSGDNAIISIKAKLPPLSSLVTLPLKGIQTLPENIISVAVDSKGEDISYLIKTSTGSTLYTLSDGATRKVRDYDLSELYLLYKGSTLVVAQKPSAFEKTYLFSSDEKNIYGGRTGQKILFSQKEDRSYLSSFWSNIGLTLFTSTLSNTNTHTYAIKTLVDKCVSSKTGNYFFCSVPNVIPIIPFGLPDDWYKGLLTFNDSLYVVDTVRFGENRLARLEDETGEEFDLIKPVVSTSDTYLAFSNKKNGSLWLAKLLKLTLR